MDGNIYELPGRNEEPPHYGYGGEFAAAGGGLFYAAERLRHGQEKRVINLNVQLMAKNAPLATFMKPVGENGVT